MFRFERTLTSSPPTVLSSPPRRLGELVFDCTMTFTRASPFPDRISFCKSGEILVFAVVVKGLCAALVLVETNEAVHSETSTTIVTRLFRVGGRDINLLQG